VAQHGGAAALAALDHAGLGELVERPTHRAECDTEACRKALLGGQVVARLPLAGDGSPEQVVMHLLVERPRRDGRTGARKIL